MTRRWSVVALVLIALLPSAYGAPDDAASGANGQVTSQAESAPTSQAESQPTSSPKGDEGPRDLWRDPPPKGRSEAPTATEWKKGEPIATRRPMPHGCEGWLVREWVKIRCALVPQAGGVIAGDGAEVAFFLHAKVTDDDPFIHELGVSEVVFPVRRGQQRLIELTGLDQDEYDSPHNQNPGVLISQQWLEGEPGPTLTLTPQPFERNDVMGARLATPAEAKARGVETHNAASKYGWPVIVEVEPKSPAAEAGAQVGDHLVMSWFGHRGLDHMHELLAFGEGRQGELTVQRKGVAKALRLPRRR